MNKWNCDVIGCKNSAIGIGGAIGLRAIGWNVTLLIATNKPPIILCPEHGSLEKDFDNLVNQVKSIQDSLRTDTEKVLEKINPTFPL